MKPSDIIALVLVVIALGTAAIFIPATELIPAQVQPGSIAPGLSPVRSPGMMEAMRDVGVKISDMFGHGSNLEQFVEGNPKGMEHDAPGELKVYAIWGVWFAGAMTLVALAYAVLGRLEVEEKTVLPVKK
jgi:hypothetical protein